MLREKKNNIVRTYVKLIVLNIFETNELFVRKINEGERGTPAQ